MIFASLRTASFANGMDAGLGLPPLPFGKAPATELGALAEYGHRIVMVLHDQGDHAMLRPALDVEQAQRRDRILGHLLEPGPPAWDARLLVGEDRLQQTHGVAALAVTHRPRCGVGLGKKLEVMATPSV